MKKSILIPLCCLGVAFASCSDKSTDDEIVIKGADGGVVVTIQNLDKWKAQAQRLIAELNEDAVAELGKWQTGYADTFKALPPSQSLAMIVGECADCAEELADEKIPRPVAILTTGDDCLGYIGSIRNSIFGTTDGTVGQASIMAYLSVANPQSAQSLGGQLQAAAAAIQAIPQPLASNAASEQAKAAVSACLSLEETLGQQVLPLVASMPDTLAREIVATYVDDVVTPSTADAVTLATQTLAAAQTMALDPTEANITATVRLYIRARAAADLCAAFH